MSLKGYPDVSNSFIAAEVMATDGEVEGYYQKQGTRLFQKVGNKMVEIRVNAENVADLHVLQAQGPSSSRNDDDGNKVVVPGRLHADRLSV